MNQTGKRSQMQSQGGQRKKDDQLMQPIINPDNYVEKPRPNFYNVIKLLRESKVSSTSITMIDSNKESVVCCKAQRS